MGATLVVSTWEDGTGGRPDIEATLGSTVIFVSKYKEGLGKRGKEKEEERTS